MAVLEAGSLRRTRRARRVVRPLLALLVLAALPAGALAGRALLHRGEVMPGVEVLGVDLAGLEPAPAGLEIRRLTAARLREPVPLLVEGERVAIVPAKIFTLDRAATAAAAVEAGRVSWTARVRSLGSPLTDPLAVAPVLVRRVQAERRLAAALARFGRAPVPASVELRGTEPVVRPSAAGSRPDLAGLLAALEERVAAGAGPVPVTFEAAPPPISDEEARRAAEEARLMLSAPVELTFDGAELGALSPSRLARLLGFHAQGERLIPLLDEARLATVLDPAIAPHERRAVNARFEVDGERVRVLPAVDGLGLDPAAALVAVSTAAHAEAERRAELRLAPVAAERTTAEAQALGIRERISTFTTEMGPSSANRIHNVHLMADAIDGTIVEPGARFSFNDRVGPRTEERGFLEGQMIVGSLLLPSVGGGVCQTATTLFNNAIELGLPIVERHNHSFYISHYPLGRDATVSWGGPDFVFENDMEHAILIKAAYTDATLTFTFYGTDEGRTVTLRTGERTNWREPRLTYALDPAAPPGSVRTVRGDRQQGFDVTVHRTVARDGEVLREDSFRSSYIPVGDTEIYGPGRTIPGDYFVLPTT